MAIDASQLKNRTVENGSDQAFTGDAAQMIKTDGGGLVDPSLLGTAATGFDLQNTFWADSNATSIGDGTAASPFQSLQSAIDEAELLGQGTRKIIFVAAASAFDEDVTVTDGYLTIMGLGPFTLGDAALDKFDSTTERHFTWNTPSVNTDANKWDGLIIGTIMDDETSSTHTGYMNGFVISGNFLVNNTSSNSKNLQMRNVNVQGDVTVTANQSIQTYLRRCYFDGVFFSSSNGVILNIADSCEFDELVTIAQYNRIWQCDFAKGLTTTGPINSLRPSGIFQTYFKGVFTSTSELRLDATSNYFFNDNGATLAGGATKVLLHDET